MGKVYYKPENYWRGESAIGKLAKASGVSTEAAREWLFKQAIWQIYIPGPKKVPRPTAGGTELKPNEIHQADLLYLPHDKGYKYALTVIDVASRYKEAEPLKTKYASEVAGAFEKIYSGRGGLSWPKLLQVDAGREFMGKTSELMKKRGVRVRVGEPGNHRAQGVVERFNRTLAEQLFPHQYAQEMISEGRSSEWVKQLPAVVKNLNNTVTRLVTGGEGEGMKPVDAIKLDVVSLKPALPAGSERAVGLDEKKIGSDVTVRYLYAAGEQEGGTHRRATDPIWSMKIYNIDRAITKADQPVLYYLDGGPLRSFVREELLIVSPDTQLPPKRILS